MPPPLPRCSGWAYSSLTPSRVSLPRKGHRVGLHIVLFEACSAFTRVAACTLALSPCFVTPYPKASDISSPPCLLRLLPTGAVAGWDLHPLESADFSRRTPNPDHSRPKDFIPFAMIFAETYSFELEDQLAKETRGDCSNSPATASELDRVNCGADKRRDDLGSLGRPLDHFRQDAGEGCRTKSGASDQAGARAHPAEPIRRGQYRRSDAGDRLAAAQRVRVPGGHGEKEARLFANILEAQGGRSPLPHRNAARSVTWKNGRSMSQRRSRDSRR